MSLLLSKHLTKCTRGILIHSRSTANKCTDYQYLEKSAEPTDKYQNDLPLLPIPALEDSCVRYLNALKPLIQNPNQYAETEKKVAEFERSIGKQLDHELKRKAKEITDRTYFSDDWLYAYLSHRPSIAIHMNPYLILRDDPLPSAQQPPVRATNLIISALRYRRSLIENQLKPEKFDLRFLEHLFASTRIPQLNVDAMQHHSNSRHIVLLRRGRFFSMDVIDQQGQLCSSNQIAQFVHSVYSLPMDPTTDPSICWFSSDLRDNWAQARQHLQSINTQNKKNLEKIDSALLLVCLDSQPYNQDEKSTQALGFLHGLYELSIDPLSNPTGTPTPSNVQLNRWFDKSMQIIVTSNGTAGGCFEHSWADGIIWQRVLHKIYEDSVANHFVTELTEHTIDVRPCEITFTLDERSKHELEAARKRFLDLCTSVQMQVVEYEPMGRKYLKSKQISPDFVFQLAFQMAYYKLFTGTGATYEACSTSGYKLGRTETVRSATMETKQACKAMAWGEKKYTFPELRQMLQQGSAEHMKLCKLAANGEGFDRHWYALKCLASKLHMDTPAIFTDASYQHACQFTLSTSHLYGNHFVGGGYGPVIPDGFGLAYGFSDTGMTLNCSTFETQNATEFAQAFMESLQEINNVLERS